MPEIRFKIIPYVIGIILGISLAIYVFIPSKHDKRMDFIEELGWEASNLHDTAIIDSTQIRIDSLFRVIDREYKAEKTHSGKETLYYERRALQDVEWSNKVKTTIRDADRAIDSIRAKINNEVDYPPPQ